MLLGDISVILVISRVLYTSLDLKKVEVDVLSSTDSAPAAWLEGLNILSSAQSSLTSLERKIFRCTIHTGIVCYNLLLRRIAALHCPTSWQLPALW